MILSILIPVGIGLKTRIKPTAYPLIMRRQVRLLLLTLPLGCFGRLAAAQGQAAIRGRVTDAANNESMTI